MILFLVLFIFAVMIVVDVIWIHPKQKDNIVPEIKPEMFYTPEVGYTMCDGGELIKKEENKKNESN